MKKNVTIITGEPIVAPLADMRLINNGVLEMAEWVKSHRPECLPDEWGENDEENYPRKKVMCLFPHNGSRPEADLDDSPVLRPEHLVTDNELLVELAGRNCYHSFGLKAGKKTNEEYIANTQAGEIKHSSIMYHAKMSFFIGGVSRRVSHELIRNYVGADRNEEGSPSQESTRFTHHYGWYVAPPKIVHEFRPDETGNEGFEAHAFREAMQANYDRYIEFIQRQFAAHGGNQKGMVRKRIYEAASAYLSHACETSFVWTTNPMALTKLFLERCDEAADLEFQRFANKWKRLCLARWPNLFPRVADELPMSAETRVTRLEAAVAKVVEQRQLTHRRLVDAVLAVDGDPELVARLQQLARTITESS